MAAPPGRATELLAALHDFEPRSAEEAQDVERIRQLASNSDPWPRSSPLHVTGSAVIVHPPTRRVLLRWHERMQSWLQVGGHADPGEADPYAIALREAREETSLHDLQAWPHPARPEVVQVAIVPVPAGKGEPAHQHADVRYVLATAVPDTATPETPSARLAWLDVQPALAMIAEDNLRVCLGRIAELFGSASMGR
jgi:8-oxo-dGTP pyrophosphatase MutT (NUDIX family)